MNNLNSFEKGLGLIRNNINEIKNNIFISYLVWGEDTFLDENCIISYMKIKDNGKDIEFICILTGYSYVCMGYVIAIRDNNKDWYINNKAFITKENVKATLFCNICEQNIDFNKNQYYTSQKVIKNIDSNEWDTYDICGDCFHNKKDKFNNNDIKFIDFSKPRNYYGYNTFDVINFEYFTTLKQITNMNKIKIKTPKEIDMEEYERYIEFKKKWYNIEGEATKEEMDEYFSWLNIDFDINQLGIYK